jgi:cellulose synthase/poly-beta-1,6-N-acetylglucosamine synthase-like glycosyltransferase
MNQISRYPVHTNSKIDISAFGPAHDGSAGPSTQSFTIRDVTVPQVSVLIAAWNEAAMIGRCLDSLLAIENADLEIIVCAGGTDDTLERARAYESRQVVVLEQQPGEGKQGALRRCLAESSHAIIYLTDADCVVPADTLLRMVTMVDDGSEDVVTSDSLPLPEQTGNWLVQYQHHLDTVGSRRLPDYTNGMHGRNSAVRRSSLVAAGGFGWSAPIATDYTLSEQLQRQGFKIRHLSDAPVYSEYPESVSAFVSQRSRWLRNLILLGLRYRRWSVALPAVGSSLVFIGSALCVFTSLLGWRTTPSLGAIALALIATRRARTALDVEPKSRRTKVAILSLLLLPVDIWIRSRALVDLLLPDRRWRW